MLFVDLKIDETIEIGGISVRLVRKTGQLARLAIDANKDTKIHHVKRESALQPEKNDIIAID